MRRDASEVAPLGDVSFECSMIIFGAHVFGIYLLGGTCVAELFIGCCNHHCQKRGCARNLIVHTDSNPVCLCNGMHTFQELKKIMKRRDVRFFHQLKCEVQFLMQRLLLKATQGRDPVRGTSNTAVTTRRKDMQRPSKTIIFGQEETSLCACI